MTTATKFANTDEMIQALSHSTDPDVQGALQWIKAKQRETQANATFHAFKPSGKWYASGRGLLPKATFDVFEKDAQLRFLHDANNGQWPGLNGRGNDFTLLVFPDAEVAFGYPLMFVRGAWQ